MVTFLDLFLSADKRIAVLFPRRHMGMIRVLCRHRRRNFSVNSSHHRFRLTEFHGLLNLFCCGFPKRSGRIRAMQFHRSISLFIILTLAGCATKTLPETVYEDKKNLVRLEAIPQVELQVPEGNFQHPLELSEEEMSLILGTLRLQKKRGLLGFFKRKKPTSIQAFKPNEIKIMSAPLRLALGKAKPNERVAFLFTQSRGKLLTGITSGVLFVKGDRIHLILGRYKSASRPHEKDITLHDPAIPSPPYTGFHDEKLKGRRVGQRSSRLSLQHRVIYSVERNIITVFVLEITPHDY